VCDAITKMCADSRQLFEANCPTCIPVFPPVDKCASASFGPSRDCKSPVSLDASGCPVCLPLPPAPNPCPKESIQNRKPCNPETGVDTSQCPSCYVLRNSDLVRKKRFTLGDSNVIEPKVCASRINTSQIPPCALGEYPLLVDGCPHCVPSQTSCKCNTSTENLPDCDLSKGQFPQLDLTTCCRTCKNPVEVKPLTCSDDDYRASLTSIVRCLPGEKPEKTGCGPSCRIDEHDGSLQEASDCYASLRACEYNEEPISVAGQVCPHCNVRKTPPPSCKCQDSEVCVATRTASGLAVDGTKPSSCVKKEKIFIKVTTDEETSKSYKDPTFGKNMTEEAIHVIIRKFCEKPSNEEKCKEVEKYLLQLTVERATPEVNKNCVEDSKTGCHVIVFPEPGRKRVSGSVGSVVDAAVTTQSDPTFTVQEAPADSSASGLSGGAIAGIVIGSICVAILLLLLVGVVIFSFKGDSTERF